MRRVVVSKNERVVFILKVIPIRKMGDAAGYNCYGFIDFQEMTGYEASAHAQVGALRAEYSSSYFSK